MERFSDFDCESLPDHWEVTAWDADNECAPCVEITFHDLRRFTEKYYDMTRSEAINHLARCGEDETELLLKELFKSKYK